MNGPQRIFAEGVASGLPQSRAYAKAYPKAKPKSAESNAGRLMGNEEVQREIRRIRNQAETMAGSAVLSIMEKRIFLARVVRARIASETEDSDLWQCVKDTPAGKEFRLMDKLAAIRADNDLAGDGNEADGNSALMDLVRRIRK